MILMLYTLDIQLLDLKGASSCSSGSLQFSKSSYKSGSLVLQSSANSARLGILEFLCGAVISI